MIVVPTIRENCINEFLDKWNPNFDDIIVIEDNPTKTFNLPIKYHYSWQEIVNELGENNWIISRRDSAIKCFGFLKAYQLGAEYTFVLDDDCYPDKTTNEFFEQHLNYLNNRPRWISSIPPHHIRGLPYYNKGQLNNVVMNFGLWKGVLDQDAPHSLVNPLNDDVLPTGNYIIPNGQYISCCGMNFCFKREVAILTYFPLMGEGQLFRRFDDIWFGIIAKKICDHLKLNISIGEPFIYHSKASNVFDNLIKESTGIKFNEILWKLIDDVSLTKTTPKTCMIELGEALQNYLNSSHIYTDYIQNLGNAITVWCTYFED